MVAGATRVTQHTTAASLSVHFPPLCALALPLVERAVDAHMGEDVEAVTVTADRTLWPHSVFLGQQWCDHGSKQAQMPSTPNLGSDAPSVSAAAATRRTLVWVFVLILLSLTSTAAAAPPPVLPYIPTTILLPGSTGSHDGKNDNSIAYIFAPTSSSVDLLALDISTTVRASSLRIQTITSGLPFLSGGERKAHTTAFAPAFIGNSTIGAYVGRCWPGADKPALWTLPLSNSTTSSIWSSRGPPVTGGNSTAGVPSFLGGALSFSTQVAPTVSPSSIYVYGGMCPWANTTGSTWTRAAAYSNQMLKLGQPPNAAYNVSPIISKGPPVANAGFSLTPLTPSIANRSGIITQSINSVLLGGHTQAAFINMSGAAIWSLPEEVWSFVSIKQPSSAPTELTLRKDGKKERRELPTDVDSRSGHTAILSGDGNSIVVLGGWVGDTSQAAEPQLAIIEMGDAFDKWRWKIPSAQPQGPGIFGHGATLLPGNVMMVYGGYSVGPLTNSKLKKRQAGGNVPMFLNLTSMTWSGDYTNPSYDGSSGAGTGPGPSESTPPNNNSRDIGLGVGLGVGIGGAAAIVVGILCWRRYKRNHRRNSAVRALAQDANLFLPDEDEMAERAGGPSYAWGTARGPSGPSDWYTGGPDPFVRGSRSLGYESLRGARGPSYPPPMAMRKGVNPRSARGLYVQAPGGPDNGGSPRAGGGGMLGSGNIHPIYEADEDGEADFELPASMGPDSKDMETSSDPFMTPTSTTGEKVVLGNASAPPRSTTPSPEGINSIGGGAPLPQDPEVQDWVSDIDNTDAVLAAHIGPHSTTSTRIAATAPMLPPLTVAPLNLTGGSASRRSPTRRPSVRSNRRNSAVSFAAGDDEGGRTASNLSESNRSAFDNFVSRSESVRSRPGTSSGIAALATSVAAAGTARGGGVDDDRRLGSSSGSSSGGVSFNTARSSFAAMQAEGPMLLSGSAGSGSGENTNNSNNNNNGNKIGLVRGSGGGSLLGGTSPRAEPHDDDGHDDAPGSPSKRLDPVWDYGSASANLRGGSGGSGGVLARLTPDLVRVPRTSEANDETPGKSSIIIVHDTSAMDDDENDENRNNDDDNNRMMPQYDRADTPAGQSEGSEYNGGDEKRFSRSTLASTTPSDFLSVHNRRPSTDSRFSTDSGTPHVIMTAEAVRLKRPPTIGRVLEMVERIEEEETRSTSRNSSPLRRSS
ncbi:hypothetical protein MAPG_01604 [Magnaporthiopsis poae ATCC 64411]|uniref:Galactose oxidase n=1 Tax=Magnaporthiopsis poae (strain ATCC 64411 / 73-15) TaxID=644358 RepID=A0A0C4DP50_MAGP6|nr:hypothetical protein MAPG_01604 [Magnaporthiopsis poae ATCC 64411]